MTSNNHNRRAVQQDARAWAKFTGSNYTSALRQMDSPLAQGLFGVRASARDLIAVLDKHPLVGHHGSVPILGENGMHSTGGWRFNGKTDYVELALLLDMLRMFGPLPAGVEPEVGSYSLKHTAENFLAPHCSYVSNGRLIWAAAALGLPMLEEEDQGPNLLIGVPEREHDHLRRTAGRGQHKPRADHFRPPGLDHLQKALDSCAAGEPVDVQWSQPTVEPVASVFHDWVLSQTGRDDPAGDFARDYAESIRSSDHEVAMKAGDLVGILHRVSHSDEAYDALYALLQEWYAESPQSEPIRTELVAGGRGDHPGWGSGAGDTERHEFVCPCGGGAIVEEHDNVPGFREHDVIIDCTRCRSEWRFAPGRTTRGWALLPV